MNILGKLICLVTRKHRRGTQDNNVPVNPGEQGYRCRRCGTTWTRRAPRKAQTA